MLIDLAEEFARARAHLAPPFSPAVDRVGGCFTCRFFGERVGPAVSCARPDGEHLRSQAEKGCAFWEREPGAEG